MESNKKPNLNAVLKPIESTPFYSKTSSEFKKQSQFTDFILNSAGAKVKGWLNSPNGIRKVEVLPGIFNFHPKYPDAMRFLGGKKGSHFHEEAKHKDGCLIAPFLTKDTSNFAQMAGTTFYPMGLNPPTEQIDVKPSKLLQRVKVRLDKMIHGVKLVPHSVAKDSTTSFNLLSKDMATKVAKIDIMLRHSEDIIKLASSSIDEYEYFYRVNALTNAFNGFMERRRFQTEDVTKKREVFSLESRKTGKKVPVDRLTGFDDLLAMRARLVYAGDFIINQMLGPLADWTRSYWKESPVGNVIYINRMTIADQIGTRSHVRSYDVSNFDWNLRSFFVDWYLDYMEQIYNPDVISVARRFLKGHMLAKSDGKGESGGFITVFPTLDGMTSPLGNPSGWSWVADFGKYSGLLLFCEIIVTALVSSRLGIKTPDPLTTSFIDTLEPKISDSDIDSVLSNGNREVVWFSCGDDNLPCTETEGLQNDIAKVAVCVGDRYKLPITLEEVASFTGLSFIKDGDRVVCHSNVMNIINKRLLAETSISFGKVNLSAGFWIAMTNYSDHPRFHEYLALLDKICVDYFGTTLTNLYPRIPMQMTNDIRFNAATARWLEDPSSHHSGKVMLKDVHPDVLADAFYSRPFEDYKYGLKRINSGVEILSPDDIKTEVFDTSGNDKFNFQLKSLFQDAAKGRIFH